MSSTPWLNENCGNCQFENDGQCRFNPPVPILIEGLRILTYYPVVKVNDNYGRACAQFKPVGPISGFC